MNRRLISVLMFAFIVAAGASMVLYRMLSHNLNRSGPTPMNSVLVATKNLELGVVIAEADVHVIVWPGVVPPAALVKPADAIGRGVLAPIFANEPVTDSRLGARGAGGGLAATIPPGMRAVAIHVNEIVGVAGFVVTGSHVDVLVSGSPPEAQGGGGNMTRTLLQNISVLSAGQDFKKDAEGKPVSVGVVNVLVTPEQAEMLSLASNQMTMQLVLRNPLDTSTSAIPGVTLASMYSGLPATTVRSTPPQHSLMARTVAPTAIAPVKTSVELPHMEIIEGVKRTEVKLQKTADR